MSETPISFVDDKKSNQQEHDSDQNMDSHHERSAYFESVKDSIAPPTFERFDLYEEPRAFDPEMMNVDQTFITEAPEFVQSPKSHEDNLREMIFALETDRQSFDYLVSNTKAVYLQRHLN